MCMQYRSKWKGCKLEKSIWKKSFWKKSFWKKSIWKKSVWKKSFWKISVSKLENVVSAKSHKLEVGGPNGLP